jgi:hypothetical protein
MGREMVSMAWRTFGIRSVGRGDTDYISGNLFTAVASYFRIFALQFKVKCNYSLVRLKVFSAVTMKTGVF